MKILCMFLAIMMTANGWAGSNVSIDYLYWKVQEGQLYPVISADLSVEQGIKVENQKFEYTSGFRLAAGYQFCYDVEFAWTSIHPNTTSRFSVPNPKELIVMSFFDQTDSDVPHAQSVVSHWHLKYDMLDLDLGSKFSICKRFTLRPTLGVKGGWINQRQHLDVEGILLGQPTVEAVPGTANRKNNFQGIGPSAGIDLHFGMGQFGLFSRAKGAILYGKFDLKTTTFLSDTLDNNNNPAGPKTVLLDNSETFLSPTVQLVLGGDFEKCLCHKFWVRLGVAYEVQYWWNQLRSNNSIAQVLFINSPAGGDLMMHGLTLQASIGF